MSLPFKAQVKDKTCVTKAIVLRSIMECVSMVAQSGYYLSFFAMQDGPALHFIEDGSFTLYGEGSLTIDYKVHEERFSLVARSVTGEYWEVVTYLDMNGAPIPVAGSNFHPRLAGSVNMHWLPEGAWDIKTHFEPYLDYALAA